MARNFELEKEMKTISEEVWKHIGGKRFMPEIESKQGGSSGCYYRSKHKVYYRWNVWHHLTLAGKRMLAIHELWHAKGKSHKGKDMYLHAFDILTIELYKKIYGEDKEYQKLLEIVKEEMIN